MKSKRFPQVSVKLIFKCEDRIMRFRHRDGTNDFLGGTVEWGGAVMETLKRELREELDYDLKKEPELLDVYSYVSEDKEKHKILIQYILRLKRVPKFDSLEGVESFWLDKPQAKKIFRQKAFLEKIFSF